MRSTLFGRGVLVAVGGAVMLLAACSSTSTQVSDQIAEQAKDQLDLSAEPEVSCPDDAKAEKGETFTCTLTFEDGSLPIDVTFKDDTNFTSAVDGLVLKKQDLEDFITEQIEAQDVQVASVSCPAKTLVLIKSDGTVECEATADDGSTATVTIGDDGEGQAVIKDIQEQ